GKDASYSPVVTFSINQSDGVTAVSNNLKEETLSYFDIQREIRVIPNFIDLSRFSLKPRQHFKQAIAPGDERVLVHTSNFRKVKRTTDVIRIFEQVQKKIPSKLLMVGDGPERTHAEQLSRELGVDKDIRFLGKQDAIEEILSVSDLFIIPSGSESFGLAAQEAMACKLSVISCNTGGVPVWYTEGATGYLIDEGDIESMSRNAIYILEENFQLERFKEDALVRAKAIQQANIIPLYEHYYLYVIPGS